MSDEEHKGVTLDTTVLNKQYRPMQTPQRVAIIGQGYVGLPLSIRAAEAGYLVIGYDTDVDRVRHLSKADSPIEDVPNEALARLIGNGSYCPTSDSSSLRDFDVAIIAVPTPLRDGLPDLGQIQAAGTTLAPHIRPGATVVLESTTYPGTTEELLADLLRMRSGLAPGFDFHLGYSPERLDPGNRRFTIANTPKLVSGVDAESLRSIQAFYDTLVDSTIAVSSPRVAELAKLVENTFRHVNIALVNELAIFAHELEVNIWEALDAAATKPFGFMRFNPGPGVGGHCLPIDPSYLSWHIHKSLGRSFRFVELANDVNAHMPEYVVQRIFLGLNDRKLALNGSRILLLGITYKPNTSDLRESPALEIAHQLLEHGADVRYVDDHAGEFDPADTDFPIGLRRVTLDADELENADVVVLLTDHDDVDYNFVASHARYLLDSRHRCRGVAVEHL